MKTYPIFNKRKLVDLNQLWDFKFLENVAFEDIELKNVKYDDRIPVPTAFDALPRYAGKRGLGIYRCFVDVEINVEAVLKIGGAGMSAKVYIDNLLISSHIGTYSPFEVKLPDSKSFEREIVVITDNRYDFERCPLHENYFDFYNYGGIIRQVWLEELPDNPITQVYVVTENLSDGKINVRIDFKEKIDEITFSIDKNDFQKTKLNKINNNSAEFATLVPSPTLWSVDEPNLHTITIDTGEDSITVRFGLRQVKADKGEIFLNDKPVKLLGYCRHEAHPQFGPASPDSLIIADLQILKDMGCNYLRGSHYQQDPRFLDFCDEFGFLVFSETTAWNSDKKQLTDQNFIKAQLEQAETMIMTDFNHPSIIMWGFLNEGASESEFARECYTELIKLVRKLDSSRLVTYASSRLLDDIFLDLIDVVNFNFYPGWYSKDSDNESPLSEVLPRIDEMIRGLEKLGFSDKPFIISEIGAGAIYGSRDQLNGYWSEEYQAELLRLVCNEVTSNPKIAGVSLWQFCDIRTYQGPRAMTRPRCFNNKGTFDEYRRPKAAYNTVKSIFQAFNVKHQNNEPPKISTSALKSDNGISIISTPVQRRDGVFDKGYLDLHDSHCKSMLKNNPDLVFIGDSITANWGNILDDKFKKYNPENLGIGGDWIQNLHWRIENGVFDQINPKVIVLLIGTNNLANGFIPQYVIDGTNFCIQALLQKSPNSKIVLMGIFQRNKPGDAIREKVDQVNIKTKLLANNKNIFFVNINDTLMDKDGLITLEIMPDGLHPAEPGYIIWADAITPIIKQLFKRSL